MLQTSGNVRKLFEKLKKLLILLETVWSGSAPIQLLLLVLGHIVRNTRLPSLLEI